MTEEEIREEARDVLIAAWEDGQARFVKDPNTFRMEVGPDGDVKFHLHINEGPLGAITTVYSPQPFIEKLIREGDEALQSMDGEEGWSEFAVSANTLYFDRLIEETASILLRNFAGELTATLATQGLIALSLFLKGNDDRPSFGYDLDDIESSLKDMDKQRKKAHEFFINEVKNSHVAPKVLFSIFYNEWHPKWTEVDRFYKSNLKLPNVLDVVKAAFPDCPSDIVDRLADLDTYESTPEWLSLQTVARLTGVPDSLRSKRSLQKYLKESREMLAHATDAEIEDALVRHQDYVQYQSETVEYLKALAAPTTLKEH